MPRRVRATKTYLHSNCRTDRSLLLGHVARYSGLRRGCAGADGLLAGRPASARETAALCGRHVGTHFINPIHSLSTPSAHYKVAARRVWPTKAYLYRHCRTDRSLLAGHVAPPHSWPSHPRSGQEDRRCWGHVASHARCQSRPRSIRRGSVVEVLVAAATAVWGFPSSAARPRGDVAAPRWRPGGAPVTTSTCPCNKGVSVWQGLY